MKKILHITKNDIKNIIREAMNEVQNQIPISQFGNDSSSDFELVGHFVSYVEEQETFTVNEDKIGQYVSFTVYVYPLDNGNIPHVHVVKTNEIAWPSSKKTFDCCIKLETNEYFAHGFHQSTMTSRQCKDFNDFMHSVKQLRNGQCSHYEYAVEKWDDSFQRNSVKVQTDINGNIIIPNYDTIRN